MLAIPLRRFFSVERHSIFWRVADGDAVRNAEALPSAPRAGAQESMQRHATSTGAFIRGQDFRGGPAPTADRAGDGATETLVVRGFAGEEERAPDRLGERFDGIARAARNV